MKQFGHRHYDVQKLIWLTFIGLMTLVLFMTLTARVARGDAKTDEELRKLNLKPDGQSIYKLNFWTDSSIILSGIVVAAGANAFKYQLITKKCPCSADGINFIDRSDVGNQDHTADVIANWTVTSAIIAPIIIDYLDIGLTKSFAEDMAVYLEVLSVNFSLITISKFAFQRPYPYVYAKSSVGFETEPDDYESFYSGHTATTVSSLAAAAATMNLRHKHVTWPWIVTAAAGASIATELVMSAEHFKTDCIVGGIMGIAVGTIIPGLHARNPDWFNRVYLLADSNSAEVMWHADL